MTIKHSNGTFQVVEGDSILFSHNSIEIVGIVTRFLKGSRLERAEYDIALTAMKKADSNGKSE